jgi:hypothetical protein
MTTRKDTKKEMKRNTINLDWEESKGKAKDTGSLGRQKKSRTKKKAILL